jgi:hypothetical protein
VELVVRENENEKTLSRLWEKTKARQLESVCLWKKGGKEGKSRGGKSSDVARWENKGLAAC